MSELDRMIKRAFDGVRRREEARDNAARLRAERVPVEYQLALDTWGRLNRGNTPTGSYRSPLAGLGGVAGRDIGRDGRRAWLLRDVVQAAVVRVALRHRLALQWRFVHLLGDGEMACKLGIPRHTVAMAVADAVRAIMPYCDGDLRSLNCCDLMAAV